MKKILVFLIILSFLQSFSFAFTIGDNPLDSSFHIGAVFGPGTGINFGLDAYLPISSVSLGLEAEQMVTDYIGEFYEVNINATRLGLGAKYNGIFELFNLGLHFGKIWFTASRDFEYKDAFSAKYYTAEGGTKKNEGSYLQGSLDFSLGDFILTPKAIANYLDSGGGVLEFDLNLGARF